MKVITVVSDNNNPGCLQLKRSLSHFGYELDVLIHPFEFGGQMKHIYEWCKNNWGTFLYTDGWDTFALAEPAEVLAKYTALNCEILLSAEKNCYPLRETADYYPKEKCRWRYVNGGGMMGDCAAFVKMFEDGTLDGTHEKNDQQWLAEQYIRSTATDKKIQEKFPRKNDVNIKLDTNCEIFQTIAFENDYDFTRVVEPDTRYNITGWTDRLRVKNNETGTLPVFFHGNAKTSMSKIWQLLQEK